MDLLDALRDTNVGTAFLLNQANEPVLVLKVPEEVSFGVQTPIGYGTFEWYQYEPEGVIIRTLVQVYQNSQPIVTFDTFINPNDEEGRRLLQHMATAPFLRCMVWSNDADLTLLGQKQLRWQESHRRTIQQVIALSLGTSTQWPAAKIRCMQEHPVTEF